MQEEASRRAGAGGAWRTGFFQGKTGTYLQAEGREPATERKLLECGPLGNGLVRLRRRRGRGQLGRGKWGKGAQARGQQPPVYPFVSLPCQALTTKGDASQQFSSSGIYI